MVEAHLNVHHVLRGNHENSTVAIMVGTHKGNALASGCHLTK